MSRRKLSSFVAIFLLSGCSGIGAFDGGEERRATNGPATRSPNGQGSNGPGPTAQAGTSGSPTTTGDAGSASPDADPQVGADGAPVPTTPPAPTNLPAASGPCPSFVQGDNTFTPTGVAARKARVWIGPEAQTKDGPVVFYFHGTGMDSSDATYAIGATNIAEILSMGGLVIAPHADPSTEYPWFASNGSARRDDHVVLDEIVACAIQQVGIDTRHIHATGLSAGGMLVSDLSLSRANYLASVAPRSGGFDEWSYLPPYAAPGVKMSMLVFHGGASDSYEDRIFFEETSAKNSDLILANGGFVVTCDHGLGHTEPPPSGRDAMWRFFKDHPFDVASPYATALPAGFPSYCRVGK